MGCHPLSLRPCDVTLHINLSCLAVLPGSTTRQYTGSTLAVRKRYGSGTHTWPQITRPSHQRAYDELVLNTSSRESAKVVMLKGPARAGGAGGAPRGCGRGYGTILIQQQVSSLCLLELSSECRRTCILFMYAATCIHVRVCCNLCRASPSQGDWDARGDSCMLPVPGTACSHRLA